MSRCAFPFLALILAALLVAPRPAPAMFGDRKPKKDRKDKEENPKSDSPEWAVWRGPNSNGISADDNWSPDKLKAAPKALWSVELGAGWSSVAVAGGKVFSMGNVGGQDIVYCLNLADGSEVWKFSYACDPGNYPGPRSTPVVDGKSVYTVSRNGDVYCLDIESGKPAWNVNLVKECGARNLTWGFSGSVRIEDDTLLVNACRSGVALDKKTGRKIWASAGGVGGYAVPVVYEKNGQKKVCVFGQKALYGVDFKTGREEWNFPWETSYDVNAADPIVQGDKVFITSGYGRGCAMIDISGGNAKKDWENKRMACHFSSCVLVDGKIYGVDGKGGGG